MKTSSPWDEHKIKLRLIELVKFWCNWKHPSCQTAFLICFYFNEETLMSSIKRNTFTALVQLLINSVRITFLLPCCFILMFSEWNRPFSLDLAVFFQMKWTDEQFLSARSSWVGDRKLTACGAPLHVTAQEECDDVANQEQSFTCWFILKELWSPCCSLSFLPVTWLQSLWVKLYLIKCSTVCVMDEEMKIL